MANPEDTFFATIRHDLDRQVAELAHRQMAISKLMHDSGAAASLLQGAVLPELGRELQPHEVERAIFVPARHDIRLGSKESTYTLDLAIRGLGKVINNFPVACYLPVGGYIPGHGLRMTPSDLGIPLFDAAAFEVLASSATELIEAQQTVLPDLAFNLQHINFYPAMTQS